MPHNPFHIQERCDLYAPPQICWWTLVMKQNQWAFSLLLSTLWSNISSYSFDTNTHELENLLDIFFVQDVLKVFRVQLSPWLSRISNSKQMKAVIIVWGEWHNLKMISCYFKEICQHVISNCSFQAAAFISANKMKDNILAFFLVMCFAGGCWSSSIFTKS